MPIPLVCESVMVLVGCLMLFSFFFSFAFFIFYFICQKKKWRIYLFGVSVIFWPCLANDFALLMQNSQSKSIFFNLANER